MYKIYKLIYLSLSTIVGSILVSGIIFDQVSTLNVWITISSLVNKDPNNAKALLFRQVELNWINAPLEDENDYLGLYLDNEPDENVLPVSVHRLNGQVNGQIITDYYLPQIDFYNATNQDSERADSRNNQATTIKRLLHDECIGYCVAYHSKGKISAKNCLKTNPNWMQNIFQYIGVRSLPSLMLPGSHNSATYSKQLDKSVLNIINKYQLNQDEPIFNQLVYGIRHLDLRVGYSKVKQRSEKLWIYHDIFRTEISVKEVLEQVKKFLDLTSHEIIIMDFHRFTVGFQNENSSTQVERHAKLIQLIFKHLEHYIIPAYLGQHAPINEYISMGKRLIVSYANRANIVGTEYQFDALLNDSKQQVRDIDAPKQDQDDTGTRARQDNNSNSAMHRADQTQQPSTSQRTGFRLFNKLKSFKLLSSSLPKRLTHDVASSKILEYNVDGADHEDPSYSVSRATFFFPPLRHLWPNKDTIEGLAQYMNETTCRRYFGELRSMMVELTPTVFGVLSDKYGGNRKLAQQVNRPVSDWIRDRWLHCINIVASDYFLGNDLIRMSIYANKMRVLHRNVDFGTSNGAEKCSSFRNVEHLLDKSKIPIQFAYNTATLDSDSSSSSSSSSTKRNIIKHTSSDGNEIFLRPLTPSFNTNTGRRVERKDSFTDNVSDSFTNLVSSFKQFFNL